jgi:hypothetical protein
MRKALLATTLAVVSSLSHANMDNEKFTVETHEITSISSMKGIAGGDGIIPTTTPAPVPTTTTTPVPTPVPVPVPTPTVTPGTPTTPEQQIDRAGKIIQATKDMVALGEAIYTLVQHGKPANVTAYAPISVVPKDPTTKDVVDPFEMENFSMPVAKKFETVLKKGAKEVVRFQYKVMYSYGGSYNGTGKYMTSVMIVPTSVKTSYGYNFNATMKLGGIMNNGTKANPVAGVILMINYQMNSWGSALERSDTIYINGRGELKSYIGN